MDKDKDHYLSDTFCYFDGKHNRTKGYITLTVSDYRPLLRRQIPLATMEAETEQRKRFSILDTIKRSY